MKRSRKKYQRPLKPWDKQRIDKEREILKNYGLKKKTELWRVEGLLRKYRHIARELAAKKNKEQEKTLIEKLIKYGLLQPGASLDDVLGLKLENFLERRLETVLLRKGLVNTPKQARQLIVHGHIVVEGRRVVYPSYLVQKEEENKIEVKIPIQVKKMETPVKTE